MPSARTMFVQIGRKATALALLAGLGTWGLPAKAAVDPSMPTMKNLNAALTGERNAHARYLAFAEKADQEGYGAVASLFRAAAAAEGVHGNNHERAIRKLGGTPEAKLETPTVGSTAQNLKTAISGETYEQTTMYPGFISQARQDRSVPAVVTFEQAIRAEAEHARLFQEALQTLEQLKGSGAKTYYVCSFCGFTTTDLNFEKCQSCFKPKDLYKPVS